MNSRRRIPAVIAALALSLTMLAGCGDDGADTDCNLDSCTVTFDRNTDTDASILGVKARIVSVQGDQATVEIAGQQATVTVGQPATEVGSFRAELSSLTSDQVVVRISRN